MKALVFGASGTVGQEILKHLGQKKIPTHAVRHKAPKAVQEGNVLWFSHDALAGAGAPEIWDGVSHVFLMSPSGYTNQDKILFPVIEEAKRRKIQKLVLMTAMGVNHAVGSPMQQAEALLQKSGLSYAIVRPNWFMQNFHSFWGEGIRKENKLILPVGSGKVSLIDARDIGAASAALLLSAEQGEFDITGPEAINHSEAASILSETLGRKIEYVNADPEDFRKGLIQAGLPADYAAFMLIILGALRDGHSAAVTDNVQRILKRPPLDFASYVRDFKQQLR